MEIALIVIGFVALLLVARWLHKRVEPPPQLHSNAARQPTHDAKQVAGSGSEGQSIG